MNGDRTESVTVVRFNTVEGNLQIPTVSSSSNLSYVTVTSYIAYMTKVVTR